MPHEDALVDEGLEILTADECLRLAASRPIGRVAVSIGTVPAVFPVNFCLVDGDVVFVSSSGTKLAAAVEHATVAFEVDDFDAVDHTGWSVLFVGTSEVVPPEQAAALEPLRVRPWAHGPRSHVVRIRSELVSGRRIDTRAVAT